MLLKSFINSTYILGTATLLIFVLRKKGGKTKKRMTEEEIEEGDCRPPTRKVFFKILSDLNQAVPDHLADESQTRKPDSIVQCSSF